MALAPLVSDGPIILLAVAVLSQVPESARRALYLAGGCFILYLAWGAFRRWRQAEDPAGSHVESPYKSLMNAAVMNFLNPGPYIFWSIVAGPILVEGWRAAPANGISFVAAFYVAMIATLVALIVTFGAARNLGPRVRHYLFGVSALALFGFGVYQLYRGIVG
jgi:threonine/homoserine/homoserine lactone efflux protein